MPSNITGFKQELQIIIPCKKISKIIFLVKKYTQTNQNIKTQNNVTFYG